MTSSILWSLVLAIHILGMTAWVGGMVHAVFVLRPSLGLLDATQRASVHLQTLTRFFRMVWHLMPTVLVSGWLLVLHEGGFAAVPWQVNAMQLLGLAMAALFARIYFGPFQKARRAIRPQPAIFDSIRALVLANTGLGVLTILAAAMARGL
ncbi:MULTISPECIES: CopD family protein [Nguyenibacter]|uniref:CopD family protein n=1 Tax=Nguyenibacter vanlangensis TaxID=1216886 RepID=A0A7Y7M5A6_9PROT|nr:MULTISPECIES: CopD family protein [Nguyenibacter]NVN11695.1 CopD family protein [Nguyenibacter vanlangensis]WRH87914.1 CopD family protein [Nguyenibacter sp. L1]